MQEKLKKNGAYFVTLFSSILIAFIIGGIIMAATGYNPIEAYGTMFGNVFGKPRVFGNTLAKMVTLCLTGLATAVGAKAGMFNVGGEGQLFFGGIAATMTGVWMHGVSPLIALPTAFIVAMAVGGFYAWIPAILRTKLKISEVITTIMLNSVAISVCKYLTNGKGPLVTHDRGVLGGTDAVPDSLMFTQLIRSSNLSTAIIYSAVIAFLCWYIMQRTSIGLEMKVTGENPRFAFFSGLKKDRIMIWAMVASGAICGLVGMFEVYGYQERFYQTISKDYYFDGMLVAMIMGYNPIGIILMSFFFAVINIGAGEMEIMLGVSGEISQIVFSIIIFLMAAEGGITRYIEKRRFERKAREEAESKMALETEGEAKVSGSGSEAQAQSGQDADIEGGPDDETCSRSAQGAGDGQGGEA